MKGDEELNRPWPPWVMINVISIGDNFTVAGAMKVQYKQRRQTSSRTPVQAINTFSPKNNSKGMVNADRVSDPILRLSKHIRHVKNSIVL